MKVTVKTTSGGWFYAEDAASTERLEGFFQCYDGDGDIVLAVAMASIEAVLYSYADES